MKNIKADDIKTVIKLTGTVNTRHIGGYAGRDGRLTDEMAFIRSDVPAKINAGDINFLIDRGIETVLDLRTNEEIEGTPVPFGDMAEVAYAVIPLVSDETPPHLMADIDLGNLYVHILEERKGLLAEAFRLIIKTRGGVFFNCSAGKDRTGILAMLLLMFAGVARDDIIKDYYYTEILLKPWIESVVPELEKQGISFNYKMLEALPEYIEKAISHIESNYTDIGSYAESMGLTAAEIEKITNKILKPL